MNTFTSRPPVAASPNVSGFTLRRDLAPPDAAIRLDEPKLRAVPSPIRVNEHEPTRRRHARETTDQRDETTRDDTKKRGIEKWKTIKFKAEAYAEYLQTEQQGLLEKIDDAKGRLIEKITSLKEEPQEEHTEESQAA